MTNVLEFLKDISLVALEKIAKHCLFDDIQTDGQISQQLTAARHHDANRLVAKSNKVPVSQMNAISNDLAASLGALISCLNEILKDEPTVTLSGNVLDSSSKAYLDVVEKLFDGLKAIKSSYFDVYSKQAVWNEFIVVMKVFKNAAIDKIDTEDTESDGTIELENVLQAVEMLLKATKDISASDLSPEEAKKHVNLYIDRVISSSSRNPSISSSNFSAAIESMIKKVDAAKKEISSTDGIDKKIGAKLDMLRVIGAIQKSALMRMANQDFVPIEVQMLDEFTRMFDRIVPQTQRRLNNQRYEISEEKQRSMDMASLVSKLRTNDKRMNNQDSYHPGELKDMQMDAIQNRLTKMSVPALESQRYTMQQK